MGFLHNISRSIHKAAHGLSKKANHIVHHVSKSANHFVNSASHSAKKALVVFGEGVHRIQRSINHSRIANHLKDSVANELDRAPGQIDQGFAIANKAANFGNFAVIGAVGLAALVAGASLI